MLSSLVALAIPEDQANAAVTQLSWADNSNDETGFNIERKIGVNGAFIAIASAPVNSISYSDAGLADSTTYCYRVDAFNDTGASAYTSEVCATTPPPPVTTYSVTLVSQVGGTVSSSPSGISCGTECVANFSSGTTVSLQAVPARDYSFAGWSGDSDCLDGSLTMNANKSCAATFTANSTGYLLTTNSVSVVTSAGSGNGKIVSSPAGIDCGSACSVTFQTGVAVTLQATPASGSTFVGWSGDSDCVDGSVTMSANKTCTASFKLITYSLTVVRTGTGTGQITSHASGIDCGTKCVAEFTEGTVVALTATPATDTDFSGWSGDADCLDGSVTLNGNKSCSASFTKKLVANVGIYRPATGAWYLITNPTGLWQGCTTDVCGGPFGADTDLPLVGDWNGTGQLSPGLYDTTQKSWELDTNGDLTGQGCSQETCFNFALNNNMSNRETPLVGSWDGAPKTSPGVYTLVASTKTTGKRKHRTTTTTTAGYWYFDRNGNDKWDGCHRDRCLGPFGQAGDVPVVGDWNGAGIAQIGVFTPQTGMWMLDANGNGKADSCTIDRCYGPFGSPGDLPIVGDWNGNGTAKIGVLRAATGEWFLDFNGNGQWDGADVDKYITGFGQPGDLPVAGKW